MRRGLKQIEERPEAARGESVRNISPMSRGLKLCSFFAYHRFLSCPKDFPDEKGTTKKMTIAIIGKLRIRVFGILGWANDVQRVRFLPQLKASGYVANGTDLQAQENGS
jgi:hypothetical protein